MARLNDPQPPGGESVEALKKRYIRQNREIARANSAQSIRIRTLEAEAAQLLEENIALREQVIRLTVELDRRNHSTEILSNVSATKRELQRKVQEMVKLIGGLSALPQVGGGKDKIVTGPKPVEERVWRNEYLLKVEQEQTGLEAIREDVVYPRKSLSMEDVPILSPSHVHTCTAPTTVDENDSDNDPPEPSFSAFLDMRPRHRRDSTFINSSITTATSSSRTSPSKLSTLDLPIRTSRLSPPIENKPPKRKFELTDISPVGEGRRISFGIIGAGEGGDDAFMFRAPERRERETTPSTNAEAAADEVLRRLSCEPWSKVEEGNRRLSGGSESGESGKENKRVEEKSTVLGFGEMIEERKKRVSLAGVSGNVLLAPPVEKKEQAVFDTEKFAEIDLALKPRKDRSSIDGVGAQRKALGAKTANVGFLSPVKQHPLLGEKISDLQLKPLELSLEKPNMREIGLEFKGVENEAQISGIAGGRTSRRASAQPINYALPRLNTKMRRETVEPEKTKKPRTSSLSRKAREGSADRTSRATSVENEIDGNGARVGESDQVEIVQWERERVSRQYDSGANSRRRPMQTADVYEYSASSPEKTMQRELGGRGEEEDVVWREGTGREGEREE
ncbi:hypothetical protein EV426DRAFT_178601 [Tirmania nivea]|nr:hypothetical protein EV426DRAFT_178601 [Tirmania nivea]